MKSSLMGKIFLMSALLVFLAAACGGAEPTEAPETPEVQVTEGVQLTATVEEVEEEAAPVSDAISSRQDAQGGVIQVEAQGTFVDPEFGLVSGAGRGSGFIIDPTGIAVTNNHVVTGAALLKVWVGGDTSQTYNAKVLGVSECSDLAVIQIEGADFPYFEWYTDPVEVGIDVYALGYPLGETEYTLTRGVVSKASADGETNWASIDYAIGHDATINPGNSGGPLIEEGGRVVGVNYRSRPDFNQYFAISAEQAIPIVERLQAGEDVDSIGVNGVAVVSEDGSITGIWVSSVESGSPADESGLQGGDIITKLEGLALATDGTMADYCDILRSHSPQDTLSMEVLRFASQELLEGQLNGRELSTTLSFAEELDAQVETEGEEGEVYSDYITVYDNLEAITMSVPSTWTDLNGEIWESTWGSVDFVAASLVASADLEAYDTTWDEPGVWLAASEDWGRLGGYAQLLDGVRDWYRGECRLNGTYDYGDSDPYYEGKYDLWEDCGNQDTAMFVLAVRPKNNPTAFLMLLQMQIVSESDLEALDQILLTFDVVGNLP